MLDLDEYLEIWAMEVEDIREREKEWAICERKFMARHDDRQHERKLEARERSRMYQEDRKQQAWDRRRARFARSFSPPPVARPRRCMPPRWQTSFPWFR